MATSGWHSEVLKVDLLAEDKGELLITAQPIGVCSYSAAMSH